ncbi:hypothetical protein QQZ08_003189 [Neonectria magnoliae]|uniref:Uncharacterized protein n=1 Tax=Neonectria magnoliae TaxID=2732573 RepID=A0ABR1IAG1_9HYPO
MSAHLSADNPGPPTNAKQHPAFINIRIVTKPRLPTSHSTYITTSDNYSYKSSGTNSQGNHYCARDYGSGASNSNSYHYSNSPSDGSYYYSNPNGSTYHDNGHGGSTYTAPNGNSYSGGTSGGSSSSSSKK